MFKCFSWTVIVRRFDGSGASARVWDTYKQGFGDADREYWLGNEYLHYLTNNRTYQLRFDLEDWDGNTAYAEYSSFIVNSEADNYRLLLGDYSGNASSGTSQDMATGFLYHNNQQFSTYDRDNDAASYNCANIYRPDFGGSWYKTCHTVSFTTTCCHSSSCSNHIKHLRWDAWKGSGYSLKKATMMMRPVLSE